MKKLDPPTTFAATTAFGNRAGADQKWTAVAAILADQRLTSVSYVDVRVPDRPAVGGTSTVLAPAPTTTP